MQDTKTVAEQQYEEFRATDHGKSFFIPTTLFYEFGLSARACGPDDQQCGINIRPTPAQETKYWIGVHRCKEHRDKLDAERHEFIRLQGLERQVKTMLEPLLERLS